MARTKWTHVYDTSKKPRKYMGFFTTPAGAAAWVKKQAKKSLLITDEPPPRKKAPEPEPHSGGQGPGGTLITPGGSPAGTYTAGAVDAGLDAAIAAAKAEEASNEPDTTATSG